jgi:lipopolysaccharide cholinephosphotransferase
MKNMIRDVQNRILEIMKYIDSLCRQNGIVYYIMGGTALGAIRHGGFIPWDDDLDIFMTPDQYDKFKVVFERCNSKLFVLQEWRTTPDYLEYAKVRMNGTTFIEAAFKDRHDMHHGIYVDIMILHKVPNSAFLQKRIYYYSKFVTLYALSQRNWRPKTKIQKILLKSLKYIPCKYIAKHCYQNIYRYDGLTDGYKYCYWITPAKFKNGLFDKDFFSSPVDIPFEDTVLLGSEKITEYLEYRYGDYMKLPSEEQRKAAVHAMVFDTEKDYSEYQK